MTIDDEHCVKILSVSPAAQDHTRLGHILGHTSWRLFPARNIAGAVDAVQRLRIPVVVTTAELPDGDWRNLLGQLQSLPEPPQVIVMTSGMDDRLWSEVVQSGAYDVIPKPLAKADVFRIVSLAWRQWHDHWIGQAPVRTVSKASA